ncbi:MAG: hypothetical protein EOP88_06020 [Verrucomicrobiaceae bacterium]|nr:MAG: hypothetical protein EOP88_06020 [Verrucomicrobiaceae bacterium]
MNPLYCLPVVVLLGACAAPREALVVKQFQLRDQAPASTDEPMVRMEKERHLRGAVSMEERRARLGQYYTLVWDDPEGAGQGNVRLLFEYQQGGSGSRVKKMVRDFPTSESHGVAEFAVIGDDYFKNGKVLAWKASFQRGGKTLATKQSYLWQ